MSDSAIPWTVAYQAPPSMGFSRQEYWSGLPFPSPGDLPNPGIEPGSPALETDALPSEPPGKPTENLKDTTRKPAELINEICKVAGYKINIKKSLVFLYTSNEKSERKIKETIQFTTATKRVNYLGINLS